jgi:hypothetical protein
MEKYLAGADVTVTIPFVDSSGNAFTPSSASYRVLDEDGTVLIDTIPVPWLDPGGAPVSILVGAGENALPAGSMRALRTVEVLAKTDAGSRLLIQNYVIEASEPLVPGTNSFQTINKAELIALDIPNLPSWGNASRDERVAALIQARLNIGQMSYRYRWSQDWQNYIQPEFGLYSIIQMTQAQYLTLPIDFRQAVERAQIMEADDLLGGDPVLAKRAQGIVSETVGGSTTMFGQVRPARQLICARAMHELGRYVVKRIRLSRT